jgi:hypothetical protein
VQLPSKTNINAGWNHYIFGMRSLDMIYQAIFLHKLFKTGGSDVGNKKYRKLLNFNPGSQRQ